MPHDGPGRRRPLALLSLGAIGLLGLLLWGGRLVHTSLYDPVDPPPVVAEGPLGVDTGRTPRERVVVHVWLAAPDAPAPRFGGLVPGGLDPSIVDPVAAGLDGTEVGDLLMAVQAGDTGLDPSEIDEVLRLARLTPDALDGVEDPWTRVAALSLAWRAQQRRAEDDPAETWSEEAVLARLAAWIDEAPDDPSTVHARALRLEVLAGSDDVGLRAQAQALALDDLEVVDDDVLVADAVAVVLDEPGALEEDDLELAWDAASRLPRVRVAIAVTAAQVLPDRRAVRWWRRAKADVDDLCSGAVDVDVAGVGCADLADGVRSRRARLQAHEVMAVHHWKGRLRAAVLACFEDHPDARGLRMMGSATGAGWRWDERVPDNDFSSCVATRTQRPPHARAGTRVVLEGEGT